MQYAGFSFLQPGTAARELRLAPDRAPRVGYPFSEKQFQEWQQLLSKVNYLPVNSQPFRPQQAVLFTDEKGRVARVLEISFGGQRAQVYGAVDRQRRECGLDFGKAAGLFAATQLPLSADGNTALEFSDSIVHPTSTPKPKTR